MIKFELVTAPIPLRCLARRGPRSRIECEMPALHAYGDPFPLSRTHSGRSRVGAWFFWPAPVGGDGGRDAP